MNREEAILLTHTRNFNFHNISFNFVENLVNKIYGDFENRTCENCNYYELRKRDSHSEKFDKPWCFKLCETVSIDFGCNKFKRNRR